MARFSKRNGPGKQPQKQDLPKEPPVSELKIGMCCFFQALTQGSLIRPYQDYFNGLGLF